MISTVFHAVIYDPLYNGLIFLVGVVPSHDVGLAVIALTIVVRVILLPLSRRAVETQIAMKKVAPEIEKIKEKFKDNREEQGKAIFALYKERGVHPFASFGLLLPPLPPPHPSRLISRAVLICRPAMSFRRHLSSFHSSYPTPRCCISLRATPS